MAKKISKPDAVFNICTCIIIHYLYCNYYNLLLTIILSTHSHEMAWLDSRKCMEKSLATAFLQPKGIKSLMLDTYTVY